MLSLLNVHCLDVSHSGFLSSCNFTKWASTALIWAMTPSTCYLGLRLISFLFVGQSLHVVPICQLCIDVLFGLFSDCFCVDFRFQGRQGRRLLPPRSLQGIVIAAFRSFSLFLRTIYVALNGVSISRGSPLSIPISEPSLSSVCCFSLVFFLLVSAIVLEFCFRLTLTFQFGLLSRSHYRLL